MPGRVLNFFEFSDKYSNSDATEKDLQDVTSAASNFSDGFDDSTYDQPEIKPNRPVSGSYEATPSSPAGFNPEHSEEMNAPEGEEDDKEEDEDAENSEPKEADEDDDNDSAAGNPEDANESKRFVRSFSSYLNESRSRR